MSFPRFRAIALACVFAVPAMPQALAQEAAAPTSPAAFLSVVLTGLATIITVVIVPLAIEWGRGMIAERRLKNKQIEEQARGAVGALAQKAIGGALADIAIPEGPLKGAIKDGVILRASEALARNASESFGDLGVKNEHKRAKAKEVIISTLGLMDAQAAGNPVPNPSQPVSGRLHTTHVNVHSKK